MQTKCTLVLGKITFGLCDFCWTAITQDNSAHHACIQKRGHITMTTILEMQNRMLLNNHTHKTYHQARVGWTEMKRAVRRWRWNEQNVANFSEQSRLYEKNEINQLHDHIITSSSCLVCKLQVNGNWMLSNCASQSVSVSLATNRRLLCCSSEKRHQLGFVTSWSGWSINWSQLRVESLCSVVSVTLRRRLSVSNRKILLRKKSIKSPPNHLDNGSKPPKPKILISLDLNSDLRSWTSFTENVSKL